MSDIQNESNMDSSEAEKRNAEIFRNLTFDQEGNPIQTHQVDPDKLANQTVLPRYKVCSKHLQS